MHPPPPPTSLLPSRSFHPGFLRFARFPRKTQFSARLRFRYASEALVHYTHLYVNKSYSERSKSQRRALFICAEEAFVSRLGVANLIKSVAEASPLERGIETQSEIHRKRLRKRIFFIFTR